jgi:hypothetical protein
VAGSPRRQGLTRFLAPVGAPFRLASAVRRARVFHPDGVAVAGDLVVGAGLVGSELLSPGRRTRALVRLSRGIGLPERWPDVLGLAAKVPDAYGRGADQDFLLATVPNATALRRRLALARSFDSRPYSTLLRYGVGGRAILVGATVTVDGASPRTLGDVAAAVRDRRLSITLLAADAGAPSWRAIATIRPDEVLADPDGRRLGFDPWNTGGGIRPLGFLNRLRRVAYPASRRGRAGR